METALITERVVVQIIILLLLVRLLYIAHMDRKARMQSIEVIAKNAAEVDKKAKELADVVDKILKNQDSKT